MGLELISTRGQAPPVDMTTAILSGLAPDGGLYVPDSWPRPDLADLEARAGFPSLAAGVLHLFVPELIAWDDLRTLVHDAFARFAHPDVAPLTELGEDLYLMELFWGPTLAFKDFALQVLGRLFDRALARTGGNAMILGATSGDTGSAAMEAFRDRDLVDVVILFPEGRTTEVQRRQMTTVDAPNVHAVAVDGTFDDCQDLVKAVFGNRSLRDDLSLSTANSINFGRLMTQIAYYFWAALSIGRRVSFAVPSGNFGNVYSGYAAARMGLPVERLIVGSNSNHVLHGFFRRSRLELGEVVPTLSPSMDIQIPFQPRAPDVRPVQRQRSAAGEFDEGTAQASHDRRTEGRGDRPVRVEMVRRPSHHRGDGRGPRRLRTHHRSPYRCRYRGST